MSFMKKNHHWLILGKETPFQYRLFHRFHKIATLKRDAQYALNTYRFTAIEDHHIELLLIAYLLCHQVSVRQPKPNTRVTYSNTFSSYQSAFADDGIDDH